MIELDHLVEQADGSFSLKPKAERKKARRCMSPVELMFFNAAYLDPALGGLIKKQYQIGTFRVDFALPSCKVVIEIDGHQYHSTKQQRQHDLQRQRWLQERGWTVIRFTGSEVYKGASACVEQVKRIITYGNGRS